MILYEDEDTIPYLALGEVVEELKELGALELKEGERVKNAAFNWNHTGIAVVIEGNGSSCAEVFDIDRLRELGIGGTATHIAFGRRVFGKHGETSEDVLYTFMD